MERESPQFDPTGFRAVEAAAFRAVLESPGFEQFDQWMSEAVAECERRWAHLAAPIAERNYALLVMLDERHGKLASSGE